MSKLTKELLVIALAAILFVAGMFTGYSYCKSSRDAGVIKQQQQDAKDVDKHNTETVKVNENVNVIIETKIKKIVDKSKCLDTASPGNYLNELFNADSKTKPGTN